MFLLAAVSLAQARPVTALWDANSDGITVGYRFYYGTAPGNYSLTPVGIDVGNATTASLNLLPGATYYFVVRAYDASSALGPPSSEVSITLPNSAPVLTNPSSQSGTPGAAVSLQLASSDPNGDTTSFPSVTGLPPGLTASSTGLISGTLSGGGSYTVTATVSDGSLTDVEVFTWIVATSSQMTTPLPGATLGAATQTFSWSAGTGVTAYWLEVGTTGVGSHNISNFNAGALRTTTVSGLPTNGSAIYARVSSLTGSTWNYVDYTLTSTTASASVAAQMTTPTPSATLTSASQTFTWTAGTGVSAYWLDIGTTGVGSQNVANFNAGTLLTTTVSGLPTNGSQLYIRLSSRIGAAWSYVDYTVTSATTTASAPAQMTTPLAGATLATGTQAFSWSAGTGVTGYWFEVGTTGVGSHNITNYNAGMLRTTTVSGLPTNGSAIYVRVSSLIGSTWSYVDYTLTSATITGSTLSQMTTPLPAATLAGATQAFSWSAGTGVGANWLEVGTTGVGSHDISNFNAGALRTTTVNGLPTNGSTLYVRLWSMTGSTWASVDYTLTSATLSGTAGAQLTTPLAGATLAAATQAFSWSAGTGVTGYWLEVGTTGVGSHNVSNFNAGMLRTTTVSGLPINGSALYVRVSSLIGSTWSYVDYTLTSATTTVTGWSQMTTPLAGATLSGAIQTFSWTAGTGVSGYWLEVGTTAVGSHNISNFNAGTLRTTTVTGLPTNGSTIYVRLWSLTGSAWNFVDYTLTSTAAALAQLTTPVAGATLAAPAQTFSWSTGTGVTGYWLQVGATGKGSTDLANFNAGTLRTRIVTGIPATGRVTIYVRLWSLTGSTWTYVDSTFLTP